MFNSISSIISIGWCVFFLVSFYVGIFFVLSKVWMVFEWEDNWMKVMIQYRIFGFIGIFVLFFSGVCVLMSVT